MKISIAGVVVFVISLVAGCGGGGNGNSPGPLPDPDGDSGVPTSHLVSATAGIGGRVEPDSQTVDDAGIAVFTVTPELGYVIDSVHGCGGFLDGTLYTTAPITAACTLTAEFAGDDNPILLSPPDLYGALLPGMPALLQPEVGYTGDGRLYFELLIAPDTMKVDPRSGALTWTPAKIDAGSYSNVHLQATDGVFVRSIAFTVRVAAPSSIQTHVEDLVDGRTRITVIEPSIDLKGLEVILPAEYAQLVGATGTDPVRLGADIPGIALVDHSDVPGDGELSESVIRLTEFFRIEPASASPGYIEIISPQFHLPEGHHAEELMFFVFGKPLGATKPFWVPISHALRVIDGDRARILVAATGQLSFIGLQVDELDVTADSELFEPLMTFASSSVNRYTLATPYDGVTTVPVECITESESRRTDTRLCTVTLPTGSTSSICPVVGLNECTAKIRVRGFPKNKWTAAPHDFDVHYVAGWAVDSLLKFNQLGLGFDDWPSQLEIGPDVNIEVLIDHLENCWNGVVYPETEAARVIHLNSQRSCLKRPVSHMATVFAHEYFHHAQARTGDVVSGPESDYMPRHWMYEGTATWFQDEVYDSEESYRVGFPWGAPIAEPGLSVGHNNARSVPEKNGYARFSFFKLLQQSRSAIHDDKFGCDFGATNSDGRTLLGDLFQGHAPGSTGGERLKSVLGDSGFSCNFGEVFGPERVLANALEYFTWATQLQNDMRLLDGNEPTEPRYEFKGPSKEVVLDSSEVVPDASASGGWRGLVPPMSSVPIVLRDMGPQGAVRTLTLTNLPDGARIGVSLRDSAGLRHAFDVASNEGQFRRLNAFDGVDGWFLTLVNANPDQTSIVSFSLARMEWNTLAAFVRDPNGQEYWLEGKRWPGSDGTSWFELYGPDGISCTGEFDASGQGVLECNTGWTFSISIPQAAYEKGSGSHHSHSDDGFFVSVGWGGHADRDTLLERVVFVSQVDGAWDVFSVVLDGSDLVNLTETTANDRLPAVSPSLTKIAFVSDRDGQNDIYVMNIDGSDVKRLTNHSLDDAFPVWSPDGNRIAFISQRGSGGRTYDIYVMDSDGGNVVRLTDSPKHDTQPHWSSGDEYIVFVSEREGASDIFLMKADGSDQTNLTKTLATDTIPFFSPDGLQIAFVSDRDGDFDLWIMDVNGQNLVKLTSDGTDGVGWYSWSPDGSLIAFDSMASGVYNIYVVDPVTGIIRQVTDSAASDRFASWTWYGSKIAYLSDEDGSYTINVVDPDGEGVVRLFEGAVGEVFLPAASPVYDEGGGCFIATAAYGSYLEPRVAKLREFRDDYLLTTSLGKVFVSHYYMWSPPIADVIRQHGSLRVITRAILTPIVFGVQYPMQSTLILFVVGFVLVKRSRRESSRMGKQEHVKAL